MLGSAGALFYDGRPRARACDRVSVRTTHSRSQGAPLVLLRQLPAIGAAGGTITYSASKLGPPSVARIKVYGQRMAQLRGADGKTPLEGLDLAAWLGSVNTPLVSAMLRSRLLPLPAQQEADAVRSVRQSLQQVAREVAAFARVPWDVRVELTITGGGIIHAVHHLAAVAALPPAKLFIHANAGDLAKHASALVATLAERLLADCALPTGTVPTTAQIFGKLFLQAVLAKGIAGDVNGLRVQLGGREADGLDDFMISLNERNLPRLPPSITPPNALVAKAFRAQAPFAWRSGGAVLPALVTLMPAIAHASTPVAAIALLAEVVSVCLGHDVIQRAVHGQIVKASTIARVSSTRLVLATCAWAASSLNDALEVFPHRVVDELLKLVKHGPARRALAEPAPPTAFEDAKPRRIFVLSVLEHAVRVVLPTLGQAVDVFSAAVVDRIRADHEFVWALLPAKDGDNGVFAPKLPNVARVPLWRLKKTGTPAPLVRAVLPQARILIDHRPC